MDWVIGQGDWDRFILWLYGPAGSGKSVIGRTIAEQCFAQKRLLAGFFFSRSDGSRNNLNTFIATIAYQIAINFPLSRGLIEAAVQNDPAIFMRSLKSQFTTLIIDPLLGAFRSGAFKWDISPCLVILDGLDECDPNTRRSVLDVISTSLPESQLPLKFLIASRPEPDILLAFNFSMIETITNRLALNDSYFSDTDVERIYHRDFFLDTHGCFTLKTCFPVILPTENDIQPVIDKPSGETTMAEVKAVLDRQSDPTAPSRCRRRTAVPANGPIFHGRDPLVAQLVHILTSISETRKRPHVCLLGPGGMGKTSTALAVMAHPTIRRHFPDQNLIWVPCVKATSVSLFLDTLYSSLGTTQNTGNNLMDIIYEIKSSAETLIILFDNFETPWNIIESRSETEQILYEIDQIAHVTMFITMRSSIPPCYGKRWQSFDIEAVDEDAALQIYSDICSAASSNDPKLPVLLQVLGHMPLAITLMANIARTTGWGADKLMQKYEQIGTSMVGRGVDAKHSLDISIRLSVDSPPMKKHPEAYEVLETLAMLPVGTTDVALEEWWAHDSPNLVGALQVLAETSLIQRQGTSYSVLPVIRSYILDSSRLAAKVQAMMIDSACNFLMHHNSSPGDFSFKDHADALSAEEGNLQAILLATTDPGPRLIEALMVLARHQLSTRPRLEVVEHALKLARRLQSQQSLIGDVLSCYGRILFNLDHYDHAVETFKLASQTFTSNCDKKHAARCSLDLVAVYTTMIGIQFDDKLSLAVEARSVFEKLGDAQGVALSLYYLGTIHGQHQLRTESIEFLTRARLMFQHLGDVLNQAKCTYFLEQVYHWDRRYDDAWIAGTAAVQEYEDLGQYSGDPMQILGLTLFMQGKYRGALETLVRTLTICKSYGSPMGIAQTLEAIGRTWAKMDRIADAQGAYTEAMQYFDNSKGRVGERGMIRCRFLTRQAENPFLGPTSEERAELLCFYNDF